MSLWSVALSNNFQQLPATEKRECAVVRCLSLSPPLSLSLSVVLFLLCWSVSLSLCRGGRFGRRAGPESGWSRVTWAPCVSERTLGQVSGRVALLTFKNQTQIPRCSRFRTVIALAVGHSQRTTVIDGLVSRWADGRTGGRGNRDRKQETGLD